jgi:ribosomal protein S18 acetylase RimI-like enzyme
MTIELQRYVDPVAFRDAVDAYLRANLNACNQLFININNLTAEQVADRNAWLVRLHQSGKTCGLAMISTALPLRLLSMSPMDDEGAALVAAALIADGIKLDGLYGSVLCAPLLAKHLGVQTSERVRLGNHVLDIPPLAGTCVGGMRAATLEDYDLLLAWEQAFVLECGLPVNNAALPAEIMERLKAPAALMWIWEVDNIPVAMAFGRPCDSIARIGMVYTAPDRRGHGYAGALVAGLSAGLQARGCSSVFLYTDLANRTSNGIYRRIGYRLLGELTHLDILKS